jgi:signal transduction histidine kinase
LSRALHTLAAQLSARLGALQDEDVFFAALVDSLHEGVIAVDGRRQVARINAEGRAMLDIRLDTPFSADLLPRNRLLREALSEALAGRITSGVEIEVVSRRLALTARPLSGGGAVLALFDMTPIRRLETVRRDFVANVSHELRTPLTIIAGFAETLSASDVPADRRQEFAELIRSNAARMQRLVDDLLDLSRIESGGWTPMPARVPVETAIRECAAQLSAAAGAKGLRLDWVVDPDAREAFADPTAFRQILLNLIENAIRFTTEGGVTVTARADHGGIRVAVSDTGVGIPTEHLPRIFERFYRVDPGRSREQGGTGLGLAIVRHMTEAHGGTAGATSAPGRGTIVSVFFPGEPAPL